MRNIDVSTDIYAMIWQLRMPGEESENAILDRILASALEVSRGRPTTVPHNPAVEEYDMVRRHTWASDLVRSLKVLGGIAPLPRIYETLERLRRLEGRSLPRTLQATARRTLAHHSSDSPHYLGGLDLFCMPEGKGAGVWGLR
jgi:hypothetical protein